MGTIAKRMAMRHTSRSEDDPVSLPRIPRKSHAATRRVAAPVPANCHPASFLNSWMLPRRRTCRMPPSQTAPRPKAISSHTTRPCTVPPLVRSHDTFRNLFSYRLAPNRPQSLILFEDPEQERITPAALTKGELSSAKAQGFLYNQAARNCRDISPSDKIQL